MQLDLLLPRVTATSLPRTPAAVARDGARHRRVDEVVPRDGATPGSLPREAKR